MTLADRSLERVGAVWDGHRFDPAPLDAFCRDHLPGYAGPVELAQFHGGASNPTFLLTDTGTGRRYVMRKKPPGALLASAHAVEREHMIMAALAETSVPVPEMLLLCEDVTIVGTAFYLMPFLSGRIYKDNLLADMSPAERDGAYRSVARALAAVHSVDLAQAGLDRLSRGGNYFDRQIARWTKQYRETQTEDISEMDLLIQLLPERLPTDTRETLVHGDFRLENVMFEPARPEVLAVLDWELASLGDPLSDVAFFCLFYHADFMDWGSNATIDFNATGILREEQFVKEYCQAAGRGPIDDWPFYLGFSAFRLAAIAQGIQKRAIDGVGAPLRDERSGARSWAQLALRLLTT